MTDFSDYFENAIMNWLRGIAFPAPPSGVYVALFSSPPTETGTAGTEVTTIVRTAGRLAAGFSAISGGALVNAAEVNFGGAAGTATVSHVALFDAASGGNMLAHKALAAPIAVAAGSILRIAAGSLTFAVA